MRRRAAPIAAAVLLAAVLLAAFSHPAAAQLPPSGPPGTAPFVPAAASGPAQQQQQPPASPPAAQPLANASLNRAGQPVMTPTQATVAGRDVYYEVPQSPVGLIFFFHGCVHNAYDHWYSQPACPECRGAPQRGRWHGR